jgi:uncharacterized protein YraI
VLAAVCTLAGVTATADAAVAATPKVAGVATVKTGGTALNMRSGASSASARTGTVANGSRVAIVCQVVGEHVNGTVRATRIWDRLTNNSFVSDGYIVRAYYKIPVCGTSATIVEPPATSGPWMLPVAARIVSGYRTGDGRRTTASTWARPGIRRSTRWPPPGDPRGVQRVDEQLRRRRQPEPERLRLVRRDPARRRLGDPLLPHGPPAVRHRRPGRDRGTGHRIRRNVRLVVRTAPALRGALGGADDAGERQNRSRSCEPAASSLR